MIKTFQQQLSLIMSDSVRSAALASCVTAQTLYVVTPYKHPRIGVK